MPKSLTPKQEAFAVAVVKGANQSDAYREVYKPQKWTPAAIHVAASRLVNNDKVSLRIAELREATAQAAQLTIVETIRELRAILVNDPGLFLTDGGAVKPVSEWTPAMRSAISSLEVEERYEGHGKDREFVGYTKKLKFWDKNAAIEKSMKHLGLFEKDNNQKGESVKVQVLLVGPE